VTDFHPSSYALATQETSFKKDQAEPRRAAMKWEYFLRFASKHLESDSLFSESLRVK